MFRRGLVLFFCSMLLVLILGSSQEATAIYNGTISNGEYPWMVLLKGDGWSDPSCGGVLIDSEWVLTAHHCWKGQRGSFKSGLYRSDGPVIAYIGGKTFNTGNEVLEVVGEPITYSSNEFYDYANWPEVDLSLWRLSKPSMHKPIAIGNSDIIDQLISNKSSFIAMGYGYTDDGQSSHSDYLYKFSFNSMTTTQYTNFLAANISPGDASICERDSGSPLIYSVGSQNFLAGLVHGGNPSGVSCGSVTQMIFEQVPDYKSWIYQTIDSSSYSSCIDNSVVNQSGDRLRLFDQTHCNGGVWSTNQTNQSLSIGNFSPYSMDIQPGYSVVISNSQSSTCYAGDLWNMYKDYYPGTHSSIANNIDTVKLVSGGCPSGTPSNTALPPDTQPLPPGPQDSSAGGGFKLFQFANFEGELLYTFNEGVSSLPNAEGHSFQLIDGWSVLTCRDDNLNGECRCWDGSENNMQDHSDWQNKTQSLQVYNYNACSTQEPTPTTIGVQMYRDINYGSFFREFNVNFHQGMLWDEGIESLKVPDGWSVVLHRMSDRDWKSLCVNKDVPDISKIGDWDNKVYGIDVYDVDVCNDDMIPGFDFILYLNMGLVGDNCGASVPSGGVYTISDLSQFHCSPFDGDWNDRISSFRVRDGYSMKVWDDPNFSGPSHCIYPGGRTNFRGYYETFNNGDRISIYPPYDNDRDSRITSLAVFDNPHCDGAPEMPQSSWGYSNDDGTLAMGRFVMSAEDNNDQSITLEWDRTDDSTADGYKIYEHVDDDQYTLVETINSIYTTSWVHSGLSCGQDFHYLIKSFNEWGDSAAPNLVAVSTPACFVQPAPEAPTFVYITTDKESATVGWQDNSDNEDDFYISVNQSGTNVMNVVAPANTTMYTIEGLTCETTYEFMVYARNSSGLSSGSGYSIETQRCEGPIPNAPSHLDAYIIQQNQLTLSWHDNSEIEEDYQFQYKQRYSIEDYQTTSLPANSTGIVIDGLLCGTEYELKVTVRNFENDIYYTSSVTEYEFTFGNCPIETPTDTAVETTQTTAYVTWTDNSHNEDSFIVYAELAGEVVSSVTTEANVESATLTGLSCGLRYKFYVRGSNAERMSPYWEVYEYTNQCDDEVPYAPTNLHAVNISKDSVLIAWDDNSSVEDHFEIFENVGYYIFIDEVGENITNYTITGLDCEIDYIFRVYAVNENGFTGSNFLSVKTESCTTEVEDIFIFLPTITR